MPEFEKQVDSQFFSRCFKVGPTLNFSTVSMHQHVYDVWEREVKKYKKIDWLVREEYLSIGSGAGGRIVQPTKKKA